MAAIPLRLSSHIFCPNFSRPATRIYSSTIRTYRPQPIFRRTFASPATEQPRIRLGSVAPNFTAKTTHGDIDFHKWAADSWVVLFSHPADFTPVCTTELGAFAKMRDQFDKRGVKMIGLVSIEHQSYGFCLLPSQAPELTRNRVRTTYPRTGSGSKTSTKSPRRTSPSP